MMTAAVEAGPGADRPPVTLASAPSTLAADRPPQPEPPGVLILGSGAWGTALAIALARAGRSVTLVPRRPDFASRLASERINQDYLPGHAFPPALEVAREAGSAASSSAVIILACPVVGVRESAHHLAALLPAAIASDGPAVVTLAKGLEPGSHATPAEIAAAALGSRLVASLSGPSHAAEVAAGQPTALVLAADGDGNAGRLRPLQSLLSTPHLRLYLGADRRGVELAGALKNVYAIGAGMCDGLGLGDNARAAYVTRALAEMVRLGSSLGARPETFYGLGGVGDLAATCYGRWSRNRTFGEEVARGRRPAELLADRRSVVEGYRATRSLHELAQERGLEAPLLAALHHLLHEDGEPAAALAALMARELKREG